MKLLIFLLIFQIPLFLLQVGASSLIKTSGLNLTNVAYANEIVDDEESRYQYWLYQQNLKRARERALQNKKKLAELKAKNEKSAELPKSLPAKVEPVVKDAASVVKKASATAVAKPRRYVDAQEELLNNIPKDNKQVQALLTMIDHAKVYYSINKDGRIKDILKDDRFREIYMEEMDKDTRKQTYNFFKGYQDFNRAPTEPVKPRLNRDAKVTREKMELYLETTGIKSKLTRSLTGSYPKPSQPRVYEDADTSSSATTETVD